MEVAEDAGDASPLACTADFYIKLSDVGQALPLLQRFASADQEVLLDAVSRLRLTLTCNQQQKLAAFHLDLPRRLLALLTPPSSPALTTAALHALATLAATGPAHVGHLLALQLLETLQPLLPAAAPVGPAALACLRALLHHGDAAMRAALRRHPEVVAAVAGRLAEGEAPRQLLCELLCVVEGDGGMQVATPLLLDMLAGQCVQSKRAALMYTTTCLLHEATAEAFLERDDLDRVELGRSVVELMSPEEEPEIRLLACNVLALAYHKGIPLCDYQFVVHKLVPVLARLCRAEEPAAVRVSAAESITLLIDDSPQLQEYASYTQQLLAALADYFQPPPLSTLTAAGGRSSTHWLSAGLAERLDRAISVKEASNQLKRAAFLTYSALAASSENIRKRIAEMDGVIAAAVGCVTAEEAVSGNDTGLLYAALRFLLSLSRSVQQLRTVFKEHSVWQTALTAMKQGTGKVRAIASALIANLSVEFSPNQHNLMTKDVWAMLGDQLLSSDDELVLNAIWTLMNMTYTAPASVKRSVLEVAPVSVVDDLLRHPNAQIQSCALGLLRNFFFALPPSKDPSPPPPAPLSSVALGLGLSSGDSTSRLLRRQHRSLSVSAAALTASGGDFSEHHRDVMEWKYCQELLRCLLAFLASGPEAGLLEQGFCALGNVCTSGRGQQLVLHNAEALGLLKRGLQHNATAVQRAVVFCVSNLARTEEDGYLNEWTSFIISSTERQRILIDNNFQTDLKRLMHHNHDSQLFDRVKTALQYLGGN